MAALDSIFREFAKWMSSDDLASAAVQLLPIWFFGAIVGLLVRAAFGAVQCILGTHHFTHHPPLLLQLPRPKWMSGKTSIAMSFPLLSKTLLGIHAALILRWAGHRNNAVGSETDACTSIRTCHVIFRSRVVPFVCRDPQPAAGLPVFDTGPHTDHQHSSRASWSFVGLAWRASQ
jgi:hypothetical protein